MGKISSPQTFAEVDLDRINANLDLISSVAKVPMAPVIKANAYGHGAVIIARELEQRRDVIACCVATVAEGVELRSAGIKKRIFTLGGIVPEQAGTVVEYGLEAVLSDLDSARALSRRSKKGERVSVHFKINTGMTRLGADPEMAVSLFAKVAKLRGISLAGIMTHFADATTTREQTGLFSETVSAIRDSGHSIPAMSAANTSAIFLHPESRLDYVRPGIGIYGIQPFGGRDRGLLPALSLKSRISLVRKISRGSSVSYGGTWKSPGAREVALLPTGYADGYPRNLSNKARAIINGKTVRQIGTICMDNCLFDVTGLNAKMGDVMTLIGEEGGRRVTTLSVAKLLDTIAYEVLCGIGRRVTRVYRKNGKIYCMADYLSGGLVT